MRIPKTLSIVAAAILLGAAGSFAQIKSPAASPYSELKQMVGVTEFTVKYSRPGVKGREVYGQLVPYGEIWRTGANAPTKIAFDSEVNFAGSPIPAGEYVLFTIPAEDVWTVIVYADTEVPSAGAYDSKQDVARVKVEAIERPNSVENFTIGFDALRDESATLFLDWDNVRVPVQITVDTTALTAASIEASLANINDWGARDYADAAEFYHSNGKDSELALEWMHKAVSMSPNAFWLQYGYAKMLAEQGNTQQALMMAKKSLKGAQAAGNAAYISRNEALLAKIR
ncbi:DUF2911 domain-containing protein [Coraliomargarita algicola]|uniref:DUF2911 domain-containing protein n=1 Tax=Coraliomargarita algicola TaxID=3092156 RepID=A0ABZ0RN22_9BACT|nr:DUF2911 domain-containing protein [Coraliomargarita sp. J2-16]MBT64379.1 dihydrolipoamide dehydrogenase [Puniceicoccaceae bacterium]WPJ96322.1 DUF2911 domain-containing protein [Coraliomargarita sp. J2-16]HBR94683.1 dihydrolipoamide dehydrogenase [Opitutae bacterium]